MPGAIRNYSRIAVVLTLSVLLALANVLVSPLQQAAHAAGVAVPVKLQPVKLDGSANGAAQDATFAGGAVNAGTAPAFSGEQANFAAAYYVNSAGKKLKITDLSAEENGGTYTVHVNSPAGSEVDLSFTGTAAEVRNQLVFNYITVDTSNQYTLQYAISGADNIKLTGSNLVQKGSTAASQFISKSAGGVFELVGPRDGIYKVTGSDFAAKNNDATQKEETAQGIYRSNSMTVQLLNDYSTETETRQLWQVRANSDNATLNVAFKKAATFRTTWRPNIGQSDVPTWGTSRPTEKDNLHSHMWYHPVGSDSTDALQNIQYNSKVRIFFDLYSPDHVANGSNLPQSDYMQYIKINGEAFIAPFKPLPKWNPADASQFSAGYMNYRTNYLNGLPVVKVTPTTGPNAGSTITIKMVDLRSSADGQGFAGVDDSNNTLADNKQPGQFGYYTTTNTDSIAIRANNWSFRYLVEIDNARPYVPDVYANDAAAISFDTAIEHSNRLLLKNIGSRGIETDGRQNKGEDANYRPVEVNYPASAPEQNAFAFYQEKSSPKDWVLYNTVGNPWGAIADSNETWAAPIFGSLYNGANGTKYAKMRFMVRNGYGASIEAKTQSDTSGSELTVNIQTQVDGAYRTAQPTLVSVPAGENVTGGSTQYVAGRGQAIRVIATPYTFPVKVLDKDNSATDLPAVSMEGNRVITVPSEIPAAPAGKKFTGYKLVATKTGAEVVSRLLNPGDAINIGDIADSGVRLSTTTGADNVGTFQLVPQFASDTNIAEPYKVVRKLFKKSAPTSVVETQDVLSFNAIAGLTATYKGQAAATVTGADGNTYNYDESGSTLSKRIGGVQARSSSDTSSNEVLVLRYEYADFVKPTLDTDGISKVQVADPTNLTPTEQDAVKKNVLDANPDIKKLVDSGEASIQVDPTGKVTITYPDGSKDEITPNDTITTTAPVLNPLVEVADPANLSELDKNAITQALKDQGKIPADASVTYDAAGNATITYPSGLKVEVPRDNLVRPTALSKPAQPLTVVPTADSKVRPADQQKLIDAVKEANPNLPADAVVTADDTGKVTATFADGTTAVLNPADVLWKAPKLTLARDVNAPTDAEKAAAEAAIDDANSGVHDSFSVFWSGNSVAVTENNSATFAGDQLFAPYPALTPAASPTQPTPDEKQAAEATLGNAYPGATVKVADDGTATVTMPNGQVLDLAANEVFKPSTVKRPTTVLVQDASNLSSAEKTKVAEAVLAANPKLAELGYTADNIQVSGDGTAKVVAPSGEVVATLPNLAGSLPAYTTVADPNKLTDAEKALVEQRVKAANPDWTDIQVNDDGSVTAKNAGGTPESLTPQQTIAVSPQLTKVQDVNHLTPAEKLAVAQAIIDAQVEAGIIETAPAACVAGDPIACGDYQVAVSDTGAATLTYPADESGATHKSEFTQLQTVQPAALKSPDAAFAVADPAHLTDAEKAKLADAVRQANGIPASIAIDVADDGTVTAKYPKGEDLTVNPTLVTLPELTVVDKLPTASAPLSDDEVQAIKDAIIAKNDGLTADNISVDPATGAVTVTAADGKQVSLAPQQVITKQPKLTPVDDITKPLDSATKTAVEGNVADSLPAGTTFEWGKDAAGNDQLTAKLPNGQTVTYPKEQLVKPDQVSAPEKLTPVVDPSKLTAAEKALVEDAVRDANKLPDNATVKVADDGTVTVTYADGTTDTITPDKTVLKQPALTPVVDGSRLSDAEKQAVADAIKAANSSLADNKIVVDADGTAHVFAGDKEIATFSPAQTVAPLPALTEVDPTSGPQASDLPKIAEAIREALPGAGEAAGDLVTNPDGSVTVPLADGGSITVNPNGSADVVLPNGQTVSYNDGQTWKPAALNAPQRTPVADPNKLTQAEKDAVEAAVRTANKLPGTATVKVADDGTVTVTYVDGSKQTIEPLQAVIALPDVTPVRDNTKLTPAEVQKVVDEIIAANPTLTKEQIVVDPASGATIINDAEGNKIAELTPAQTISPAPALVPVKDMTALTPDEQKQVADNVAAQNNLGDPAGEPKRNADGSYTQEYPNGASVTVQPDGSAVVTLPNGKKVKYPAEELVRPATIAKPLYTPVVNKNELTGECPETGCTGEKAKVVEAVRAANPTLPKNAVVTVDDSGNVTITFADGTKEQIAGSDTVVQIPVLTPVTNPEKLTDAEKQKVVDAVRQANSNIPADAVVKVADNGAVTIETADGKPLGAIPAAKTVVQIPQLVPVEDMTKPTADNLKQVAENLGTAAKLGEPAGEPEVAEDGSVTRKFADGTVTVAPDGSATIVFKDGTVAKFTTEETLKPAKVNAPKMLVPVADPNHLTADEKAAVTEALRAANPQLPSNATITVADDGTATVTFADGSTSVIARDDAVRVNRINPPAGPIVVADPHHLTAAEKAAVVDAIRKANPNIPADAVISVADDGTVTVTFRDGSKLVLKPAMAGEPGGWLATTGAAAQGSLFMLLSVLLGAGGLLVAGGARRRRERNGRHYA